MTAGATLKRILRKLADEGMQRSRHGFGTCRYIGSQNLAAKANRRLRNPLKDEALKASEPLAHSVRPHARKATLMLASLCSSFD
jgi:hypothetical protein